MRRDFTYVDDVVSLMGRKTAIQRSGLEGRRTETGDEPGALAAAVGIEPAIPIEEGVRRFVAWYREFHGLG